MLASSIFEAPTMVDIADVPSPLRTLRTQTGHQGSEFEAHDAAQGDGLRRLVMVISTPDTEGAPLLEAVAELRMALSARVQKPLQAVIDLGGAKALIQRLREEFSAAVMFEAAWALTNILCGTSVQTSALIDAGAVEALFSALRSQAVMARADLCEQCMWALGNIAGGGAVFRDNLLNAGVVGVLAQLFGRMPCFIWPAAERTQVLQTLTWLMSSLCQGTPPPSIDELDSAFDYFAQVLVGTDDVRMLSEALNGFSGLFEGMGGCVAEGAVRIFSGDSVAQGPHRLAVRVVSLTQPDGIAGGASFTTTPVPALRVLRQMVQASHPDVENAVIDAGAALAFCRALQDRRLPHEAKQHAACGIGAIAEGGPERVQLLVDAGAWDALDRGVMVAPGKVQDECVLCIADMAQHGCPGASRTGVEQAIGLLSKALCKTKDEALQCRLLDATAAVLLEHGGEEMKRACMDVDVSTSGSHHALAVVAQDHGFVEALEALQASDQDVVRRKAATLLQFCFGSTEEMAEHAGRRAACTTRDMVSLAGRSVATKRTSPAPGLSTQSAESSPVRTRPPAGTSKFGA